MRRWLPIWIVTVWLVVTACSPKHAQSTVGSAEAGVTSSTGSSGATASSMTVASAPPTSSMPSGGPVPAGFSPRSFSAISATTFWLLGDAPCTQQPCTSLVRTTDGGRSFMGLPAPKAALAVNDASQGTVSEVRFADTANGWTFGTGLWATHDGSRTWNRVGLDGDVLDLARASGRAWLILGHCKPQQGCSSYELLTSPVDGDRWTRVTSLHPLGGDATTPALAVQDGAVYLHTFTPDHSIYASHDAGRTFSSHPGPCLAGLGGTVIGTPTALWAACGTGMQADLLRSTDGGAHFAEVPHPTVSNGVKLAAANTLTAVIGDGTDLLRTADGSHWASVHKAGDGGWRFIGFTTGTVADAIFQPPTGPAQLLRTTDSGRTWRPVDIH